MPKSNASQYLTKVVTFLQQHISSPEIKTKVGEKQTKFGEKDRKRMAAIITGLAIASNSTFRKTLKLADSDIQNIINKLTTDRSIADRVAKLGTRAPTILAKNEKNIIHFETRSLATKQELLQSIKNTIKNFDLGEPPEQLKNNNTP